MRGSILSCLPVLVLAPLARADAPKERDARFVEAIRKAASNYQKWGRVDERPNIAPELCRAPLPQDFGAPSHVQLSQADDGPHAQKLYYLWASDRGAYLGLRGDEDKAVPVGFSIVKQSFGARELAARPAEVEAGVARMQMGAPPPVTWLEHDGKVLAIDRPRDLFVITKVAGTAAAGTDAGWIYGTVAPDGSVTSAGRVARCMHCHDDAAHERLFGPR